MDVQAELFGGKKSTELVSIWNGALVAENSSEGRYTTQLPELTKEGVYRVVVEVDGKTFSRSVKHQMTLREAFSADIREKFENGTTQYILTVNAFQQDVNYQNSQIVATIKTPDDQKIVRALSLSDLDAWQTAIDPDSEGVYEVIVKVKGVGMDGTRFEYFLDPLSFNYSVDGGMQAKPEPFVDEPETEPEAQAEESSDTAAKEQADKTKVVTPAEAPKSEGMPDWILYAILGVGNLLLLGLGFFAYKKIMGGPKDDPLEELEKELDASEEQAEPEKEEAVAEATAEEAEPEPEPEEDEEPPMEDLDPDPEPEPAPEIEPELDEEPELELLDEGSEDDDADSTLFEPQDVSELLEPESELEPEPDDGMELLDGLDEDETEAAAEEGLDDLDAMAMEAQDDNSAGDAEIFTDDEDEEEDMASAMLKAQGLDLAEEELDDAISSLIDNLEDDDDEETKDS
jgi:uncharacterized protein YihD (DUF1040 family)